MPAASVCHIVCLYMCVPCTSGWEVIQKVIASVTVCAPLDSIHSTSMSVCVSMSAWVRVEHHAMESGVYEQMWALQPQSHQSSNY